MMNGLTTLDLSTSWGGKRVKKEHEEHLRITTKARSQHSRQAEGRKLVGMKVKWGWNEQRGGGGEDTRASLTLSFAQYGSQVSRLFDALCCQNGARQKGRGRGEGGNFCCRCFGVQNKLQEMGSSFQSRPSLFFFSPQPYRSSIFLHAQVAEDPDLGCFFPRRKIPLRKSCISLFHQAHGCLERAPGADLGWMLKVWWLWYKYR
ncbi:hypothetical protein HOY80DRAFT_499909 [Tuber brumale]|nr:hypothetical protein HOY80DRAFT_499909 [Tuber brumale]